MFKDVICPHNSCYLQLTTNTIIESLLFSFFLLSSRNSMLRNNSLCEWSRMFFSCPIEVKRRKKKIMGIITKLYACPIIHYNQKELGALCYVINCAGRNLHTHIFLFIWFSLWFADSHATTEAFMLLFFYLFFWNMETNYLLWKDTPEPDIKVNGG